MGINLDSKTVPDHKVPALARVPNCTAVPDHKVPRYTREFLGDRCLRGKYDSHATMQLQPTGDQTSEQEDGGDSHGHHGHGHPRHPAATAAANLGEELLCTGKSARRLRPAASVRECSL